MWVLRDVGLIWRWMWVLRDVGLKSVEDEVSGAWLMRKGHDEEDDGGG
jgi:hypothetical protein